MISIWATACAHHRTVADGPDPSEMIENPFAAYGNHWGDSNTNSQNITLRSKKGDRAVEVEFPDGNNADMVVPMNPKFSSDTQRPQVDGIDYRYQGQKPTMADRELASTFAGKTDYQEEAKKREIETSLGLQASDETPNMDESYLSRLDVVKQLFKTGRNEAAMIEIDHMVRDYPTNARLYEMRGTVLDRMGYADLAVKSWKQALELDPSRLGLKKVIEKREQQRSVASERR